MRRVGGVDGETPTLWVAVVAAALSSTEARGPGASETRVSMWAHACKFAKRTPEGRRSLFESQNGVPPRAPSAYYCMPLTQPDPVPEPSRGGSLGSKVVPRTAPDPQKLQWGAMAPFCNSGSPSPQMVRLRLRRLHPTGRRARPSPLVPPDPGAQDCLSDLSEGQGAQWERGQQYYCDAHIPEGIAAGHIKSKRQRVQSEAASSSVTSMPDDWKLLAIERILDSRCATTPPLLPPVPNTHALSARGPRCCRLDGKDTVDKENGLVTEEVEMRENVEYLVLGHFERKET